MELCFDQTVIEKELEVLEKELKKQSSNFKIFVRDKKIVLDIDDLQPKTSIKEFKNIAKSFGYRVFVLSTYLSN